MKNLKQRKLLRAIYGINALVNVNGGLEWDGSIIKEEVNYEN